jgi:hypothetical protein
MNSNGSPIKSSSTDAKDLKEIRNAARDSFLAAAKRGFLHLIEEAPSIWRGPEARYYRRERETMTEYFMPLKWGCCVGVFLFFTFRVSGSKWYAQFYQKHFAGTASKIMGREASTEKSTSTSTNQWKSYLDKEGEKKKAALNDAMKMGIDIIVSLLGALSSTLLLATTNRGIQKDFVEAPLVSGKSLVYQFMCPEFQEALKHVDPRALEDRNNVDDSVQDDPDILVTFHSFVRNCKIRDDFIQSRREQGVKLHDVVPYPGLNGERI